MSLEERINAAGISDIHYTTAPSSFLNGLVSRLSRQSYNQQISEADVLRQMEYAPESREVEQDYQAAMNHPLGKALNYVLNLARKQSKTPERYIYMEMTDNIAGMTITESNGKVTLAINDRYKGNIPMYIMWHEQGHIRGERSESETDGYVGDAAFLIANAVEDEKNKSGVKGWLRSVFDKAKHELIQLGNYARQRQSIQYGT